MSNVMWCVKCDKQLEPANVTLNYLGHQITHEFPRCPVCGNVFISEEIVMGKMLQVEYVLEDK